MSLDAFRASFSQPEGRLVVASARKPVDNAKRIF